MGLAPATKKPESEPSVDSATKSELVVQAACASCSTGTPLFVQMAAAVPGASVSSVVQLAAAGVTNAAAPLPHLDQIQASFGGHDVSQVKTSVGGEAGDAAQQIGARAYAVGDRIGFREEPDVRLAAHEAAHVVQQRGGVQLKGGVGRAGDQYEQQADAAADAVVEGRSAEGILGAPASTSDSAGGVQMACACGGTCNSCSGGPQVQFELEANVERDFEPMVAGGGTEAPAAAGGDQGAPEAKDGGKAEGKGDAGGEAETDGGKDGDKKPANTPSPEDIALDNAARTAGEKQCPAEPDPPPAEKKEAGEDEGDCKDSATWEKDPPDTTKDGEKKKEPPEPEGVKIRTQPAVEDNTKKLEKTKPETKPEDVEKPKPPPGCEEQKPDKPKPDAAGTKDGGEAPDAGGGGDEQQQDPMEEMIADAIDHREGGRQSYREGQGKIGTAKQRVRDASTEPVNFAAQSDNAPGASTVASRAFVEMGDEAIALLTRIETDHPQRVRESLVSVRDGIIAARKQGLDDIDAIFDAAKDAARSRASRAKAAIRSQYIQTVVAQVASAALAVASIAKSTSDTTKAIGEAQGKQMAALTRAVAMGKRRLIRVGRVKGNEVLATGKRYYQFYMGGVTGKRDSIMKGYLTDRRAKARAKAAWQTAQGMRDGFLQEAHGQAREFAKTKSGHCVSVIKTAMGATNGVTSGAAKAIQGAYQLLGQSLDQAREERDSRTKAVSQQLRAQLAQLRKTQRKQRQNARDTAWVQILTAQLTAQQMTGDLLGAAAHAVQGVGDGLAETRTQLEASQPASLESTHMMMRVLRARASISVRRIGDRLELGLATVVTRVDSHHDKAQGQIDRAVDAARDAADKMASGFDQAMTASTKDAQQSFEGQRGQFAGHMAKLSAAIAHAFGCAVKNVRQSYEKQIATIAKGNREHAATLATSFDSKIQGDGVTPRDGLVPSIRYYACVAQRHERPAWEEIAKFILIIVIAILVSALLGPAVGALVGMALTSAVAVTIVTAIIVGAIAGAISSVAGQLFDNAMAGRRMGYGVKKAAITGAITGAIGGGFGGAGAVLSKAATAAGATILTRFAIQFTADMAAEYVSQVAINVYEGKSLGESLTSINASGFIFAGAMSSGMFALHDVKVPGAKKPPLEHRPGQKPPSADKLSPRVKRAGEFIKRVEDKVATSKPARAVAAGGRAVGAAGTALKNLGGRGATWLKGTRVGAALEALGILKLGGRGAKAVIELPGKLQDLYTKFGEKLEGTKDKDAPSAPHDAPATPKDAPAAPSKDAPAAPHEPTAPKDGPATPHEPAAPKDPSIGKPTDADFNTVESTRNKSGDQLTPAERLAEQRVAEAGPKLPVKEPFIEGGVLPNDHPHGKTADNKFCRYSNGVCSKGGKKVAPPEGMPEDTPLKTATAEPHKPTTEPTPVAEGTKPAETQPGRTSTDLEQLPPPKRRGGESQPRIIDELPPGDVRTPKENAKARKYYENNADRARKWWEKRTGQPWPTDPRTGAPAIGGHPRPLTDGGHPLYVEPEFGSAAHAHMTKGARGASDFQRFGARGGKESARLRPPEGRAPVTDPRVIAELPLGERRTPAETRKARQYFRNHIDEAQAAWERRTNQKWPKHPDGLKYDASHPRPLKEGGDPMFVEPERRRSVDPHLEKPPGGGDPDAIRWGREGGKSRRKPRVEKNE